MAANGIWLINAHRFTVIRFLHTGAGTHGGFNWSSQHLDLEVWRYGCWEAPAGDSCDARADVVAGPAVDCAA
jgi:hypothetical protein